MGAAGGELHLRMNRCVCQWLAVCATGDFDDPGGFRQVLPRIELHDPVFQAEFLRERAGDPAVGVLRPAHGAEEGLTPRCNAPANSTRLS